MEWLHRYRLLAVLHCQHWTCLARLIKTAHTCMVIASVTCSLSKLAAHQHPVSLAVGELHDAPVCRLGTSG